MDLTNLQGIPHNMQLSPGEQYLRKSIYIMFANANKLDKLCADVLARLKNYISTNLLQDKYDEDILHFFLKSKKYASISDMKEKHKLNVHIEIQSHPLVPVINIAPSLKISGQILTKMNEIGYQHLHLLAEITDSSESSNTSDSDLGSGDCVPLKRKLKTCRKTVEVNCNSMLEPHIENTTKVSGTIVIVDILIFMDEEFSTKLCDYLGLIYLKAILVEAGQTDIDTVIYHLEKKTAGLYRLIQTYINRYLISGYNNICVVDDLSLWDNFNANVRAVISTDSDHPRFCRAIDKSNFHINLGWNNKSFLDYVESIAVIINKALNFESHVVAKYECGENCYRNVKLPLISIIPLYILRYFRHWRILEESNDLD